MARFKAYPAPKPEWLQWDVSPLTVGVLGELLGDRGACHGTFAATTDGRAAAVKCVAAKDDEPAEVLEENDEITHV